MMKKIALIIVPFLLACGPEEQKPDVVFSEEKMVEVIAEFQVAEAIIRLGYHRTKDSLIYNDSIYEAVFDKLEITKFQFDTSYNYYSMHPKEFEKIYAQVIDDLSVRAAELKANTKKEDKQ